MRTTRNALRGWGRLLSLAGPAAKAVVTASIIGTIGSSAALPGESALRISVYVYNGGQVPVGTLTKAQDGAARILEQAGIKTTWREPRATVSEGAGSPDPWLPTNIELRIYNRSMVNEVPVEEGVSGFVWSFEHNIAAILYDRVQSLAASEHAGVAPILGIVMAHEIGHLLLRSREHSSQGIMRKNWPSGDLQFAAQGRLHFTAEQSHRMRDEVLRWSSQSPGAELKIKAGVAPEPLNHATEDAAQVLATAGVHKISIARATVRLYDYAAVPYQTLAEAEREASRIFRKAGVNLVWMECGPVQYDCDPDACEQLGEAMRLVMRVLPETMAVHLHRPPRVFGMSVQQDAFIFFVRVRELCAVENLSLSVILGHTMAHELGHMILGQRGHSPSGIMMDTIQGRADASGKGPSAVHSTAGCRDAGPAAEPTLAKKQ